MRYAMRKQQEGAWIGMADKDAGGNYFEWSYEDDKTRVFPIDYTMEELSKITEIDKRKAGGMLLEPQIFRDILLDLLVSDDNVSKEFTKDKYPLPLEAGMLLAEAAKLANSSPDYAKILRGERGIPVEEQQKFTKELFQNLCDNISDEDDTAEKEYYRHVLMADPDFREFILDDLWETQLTRRIKRLKECAKKAPPAMQMKVLGDCFRNIDTAAFQLAWNEMSETPPELAASLESLQSILEKLLSMRNDMKEPAHQSGNKHATYRVKNTTFDNQKMDDVFDLLRRNSGNKELLRSAREAYWRNIGGNLRPPAPFEASYLAMRRYLDDSKVVFTEPELRNEIRTQCVAISRYSLGHGQSVQIPGIPPLPFGNQYIYQFVEWAIQEDFNRRRYIFQESFDFINEIILPPQEPNFILEPRNGFDFNFQYKIIDTLRRPILFEDYLKKAWEFFQRGGLLRSKEDDPFANIDVTAKDWAKCYNNAIEFLGLMQFQRTDEEIEHMFELHIEARSPAILENIEQYINECIRPIFAQFLCILYHLISKDVEEKMMKELPKFVEIRTAMDESK